MKIFIKGHSFIKIRKVSPKRNVLKSRRKRK
ncbi:unnamed protein product, partial [Larinioides sclopetarius]